MADYDIGDAITSTVTFKNSAGTATDPTATTVVLTAPDGTTSSPTITSGSAGTGIRSITFTPTMAGTHIVTWTGTGAVAAVESASYNVRSTNLASYTDTATLKTYLGITATTYDTLIGTTITAASRAIDAYCARRFWLDPSAVARTFTPATLTMLDLAGGEIGSISGLVIKTDSGGDGTFEQTWATTDYELLPVNAATAYAEARPWTAIRAAGSLTFPWLVNTWLTRLDRVQITARWGWPAVPADVTQACLIKAARLFHRKDSPQGVAGFDQFGAVRLSRSEDSDVAMLLAPYRRTPVLVA